MQFFFSFEGEHNYLKTNPMSSIKRMCERAQKGLAFPKEAIMTVYSCLAELSGIKEGFYAASLFFEILYILSKSDGARELASSSFSKVDVDSEDRRILKVQNFIGNHYMDELRLGVGVRRLVDTTDPVSTICYDCGFNTLSNFNRLFRKHKGCSPTEFREWYFKTKVIV